MSLAPGTASLFVWPFSTNGVQALAGIKRGTEEHKDHSFTLFEDVSCSEGIFAQNLTAIRNG